MTNLIYEFFLFLLRLVFFCRDEGVFKKMLFDVNVNSKSDRVIGYRVLFF